MRPPHHLPIKYGFNADAPSPPAVDLSGDRRGVGAFMPSFDKRLWLFVRKWEPNTPPDATPTGNPGQCNKANRRVVKATLIILHGTVDHSGAYDELASRLAQDHGVAVFAPDMRGWGLSDGESMYFHDMDTFVQDVKCLYDYIHALPEYQGVATRLLMGKSLGGLISAFCVAKHPDAWNGLIGLSGAYEVNPERAPSYPMMLLLSGVAQVAGKAPIMQLFEERLIVRDQTALQAWREDPLCSKDKVRLSYLVEGYFKMRELHDHVASRLELPMLMMVGDEDRVVTLEGHKMMITLSSNEATPSGDKQLVVYEGGYHNLLQEPALKSRVMQDIEDWIELRCMVAST